ncbi:hypothetical protein IWQ62_003900 [Dispira parvispora]|uniref:Uncharacterized protein n=1 Tax=Dispira parvispora TaxID=1520584 RepID=A0A9W8ATZ0_9FUNG|nr:hypothetical protein IWQ62_003900 [Dispira parvispora]
MNLVSPLLFRRTHVEMRLTRFRTIPALCMSTRVFRSQHPNVTVPSLDVVSYVLQSAQGNKYWQDPNRPVYIDAETGTSVTIRQFQQLVPQLAAGWQRHAKLQPGDVVAVISPNDIYYGPVLFGVLAAGGTVSPINPGYTVPEIVYQLRNSGARYVVIDPLMWSTVQPALKEVGIDEDKVFTFPTSSSLSQKSSITPAVVPPSGSIQDILSLKHSGPWDSPRWSSNQLQEALAYLCFSSGTSGRSKGVMTSHSNMVANLVQINAFRQAEGISHYGQRLVGVLPFYHIYGLSLLVHSPLVQGYSVIVHRKFQMEKFLASIQKYRINYAYLVPPIMLRLAKDPLVDDYDLSSLRGVASGAAPLSSTLIEEIKTRHQVTISQAYGLTESSPIVHMSPRADYSEDSVGTLMPSMEVKLLDEKDQPLGYNQPGEMCIKGPNVMKGYINNPEATQAAFTPDGFFRTGDVAYVNERGEFFIADRLKELIKYKGFQVAPAELEAVVVSHPQVADVVVLGVYRPEQATEVPKAYVVLRDPQLMTDPVQAPKIAADIVDFVTQKVANHKKLRGGVEFIQEVPKSSSGKILRKKFRAHLNHKQQANATPVESPKLVAAM